MNTDEYKRRLLAEEQRLLEGMKRAGLEARESTDDSVHDSGDASTDDVRKDEEFTEADAEWKTLGEVRDALGRIEEGTYGRCIVDGGPIEEERLRAVPWTPVCAKHARLREAARPQRTPTL